MLQAIETWSPNHWTTRINSLLIFYFRFNFIGKNEENWTFVYVFRSCVYFSSLCMWNAFVFLVHSFFGESIHFLVKFQFVRDLYVKKLLIAFIKIFFSQEVKFQQLYQSIWYSKVSQLSFIHEVSKRKTIISWYLYYHIQGILFINTIGKSFYFSLLNIPDTCWWVDLEFALWMKLLHSFLLGIVNPVLCFICDIFFFFNWSM